MSKKGTNIIKLEITGTHPPKSITSCASLCRDAIPAIHIRTPSDILRNRELLEANGLELPLS